MSTAQQVLALIGAFLLTAGGIATWLKVGRRSAKRVEAVSDAILGRAEVLDRSGAIIQEAQPGMPAQVKALTEAVEKLADVHARVDGVEVIQADTVRRVAQVEKDVKTLKEATIERVVGKVESANAYAAIEAVAKAQPAD